MSSSRWRSLAVASASSWRRSVAAVAGLADLVVEGLALLVDDVAQLLRDVVVDATEVVLLEQVGAAPAQLLHQLAQALQPLAVAITEAALHHAAQGVVEVAVVQQVVGDLLQDAVGVQLEADLRPVPAGVREPACHGPRVPPPAGCRRAPAAHRPVRDRRVQTLASTWVLRPGRLEAMRVLRTFAFADLSGFTNYTAENGDDAAGRVLGEFRAVTRGWPRTGACGWPSGSVTAAWSSPSTRRT